MKKTEGGKVLIAAAAAFVALLLLVLLFAFYTQYTVEKELYEGTDSAAFLEKMQSARTLAENVSLQRVENARLEAKKAMNARVEQRAARYSRSLLTLVNPWNELPEGFTAKLSTVEEGYLMDRRCANALMDMIYDCREAGNLPVICSAYRTHEYQDGLYQNKILRLVSAGMSFEQAPAVAARSVAVPGTSEHQLGLAVDIIDENYVNLDAYQQYTAVQKWLMANCSNYGFILRYPNGSSDITGIIFEPWHYRYVGVSTAKAVEASGLTFEEYLLTLDAEQSAAAES